MRHALVVSIINYRTAKMTIECVQSVLEDIGTLDVQIVIVENASGDGSDAIIADWIAAQPVDTPVRLLVSPNNSGFSSGHNQGMDALDADYYLVLNSDTRMHPGCLSALLTAAKANPEAGLIAPLLVFEDGAIQESCFRFPSPMSEFIRAANTGMITKMLRRWDLPLGTDPDPRKIGWASFACIMINAKMRADIGPMDEGYFLYFEDTEYSMRARRANWDLHHCRTARVVHFRGGSAPVKALAKARRRLPAYYYSSRTRYFYQGYGFAGLCAANILWTTGRIVTVLRRTFFGHHDNGKSKEIMDIWTNILRPLGPSHSPEKEQ